MPEPHFTNLLLVFLVAFSAPFLLGLAPRVRLPSVVLEIVAGIAIGPAVLGWVEVDGPVEVLALVGLAGLLSVVLFPITGLALLRRAGMAPAAQPASVIGADDPGLVGVRPAHPAGRHRP